MYIQLIDKHKWKSPLLYIHNDEKEALDFINKWKDNLLKWAKDNNYGGMPLMRLEVNIAICDLIHKLGIYYLNTMTKEVKREGKIQSWIRLYNSDWVGKNEEIIKIKLY